MRRTLTNHSALASEELGQALANLFKAAGLTVCQLDNQPVVLGLDLKVAEPELIEAAQSADLVSCLVCI